MSWKKQGLVFVPDGEFQWSKSHAQVPVVDIINNKIWRIYYSTRDEKNQSRTSFIEVEAGKPQNILYVHTQPILEFGSLGSFDENGIMPSSIIEINNRKYLYYIGWSRRINVPYQNSIGLAISEDGGHTFKKFSEGPLIGINHIDPFFTGTIFILKDNNILRAYYLSCIGWKTINGKAEPFYVLKYASSNDGIQWKRDNITAISFKNDLEGGLVSASVIKLKNVYYMWFGYRHFFDFRNNPEHSYKIGFAESEDGLQWKRQDEKSGIDIGEKGWDSEMISYPFIINYERCLYMFYNGNGFGKTGFGYATLKI